MIVSLSKETVQNMLDKFHWGNLTQAQKISILNSAQEELVYFVNERTDRTDYIHDVVSSADEVLSPAAAGLSGVYDKYLVINVAEYTGLVGVISEGDSVGSLTLDTGTDPTISITADEVVYTITLNSSVLDGSIRIEQTYPNYAYIERTAADTFKIHVELSHTAFKLYLKQEKSL